MLTIPLTTSNCDGVTVISPRYYYPPDAIAVIPSTNGYDVYTSGDEALLAARLAAQAQPTNEE